MGARRWRKDRGKWMADYLDEFGRRCRRVLDFPKSKKKDAEVWLAAEVSLIEHIKSGLAERDSGSEALLSYIVDLHKDWQHVNNSSWHAETYSRDVAYVLDYLHGLGVRIIKQLKPGHLERYYVKAQEEKARRAVKGLRVGRAEGEGAWTSA